MRIAIDYRFLNGGPNVVQRGTGRYTQHQLSEVLKIDRENEYLLVCHNDADLSLILPEIRAARNLSVARLPFAGLHTHEYPNSNDRALRLAAQVEDWIYKQKVDLFHETTPYQIDELVLYQFDACPVVATFYDMIPMVFSQQYWPPGTHFHDELTRAFRLLTRADRLIAISESARRDAQFYLGVGRDRIDLAYPCPDPMFRRLPKAQVEATLRPLRARLHVPGDFLMSLTHMHFSKNIEVLLAAYGKFPEALRRRVPLVIVFYLRDSDRDLMRSYTERYGVTDNVIFTGLISDDELVALYNAATIVVHPSRYEGFGYPVAEAMSCGVPVITTTASSLPEVGGDAAVLVDPNDADGLAEAIGALLDDPARREEMSALSLEQAKKFNPEQLGRNTLASYQALGEQLRRPQRPSKPRVAFWTSLPPLKCGIADYSTELLKELSKGHEIELFVDDGYLPAYEISDIYPVHHHSAFERRQQQRPFDSIVYQVGFSTMHDYMFDAIRKHPGVVVIHDLICAHAQYHVYGLRGRLDDFRREVVMPEGARVLREYDQIMRLREPEQNRELLAFFDRHLLLKWMVDSSLGQLVHCDVSCDDLRSRYPNARPFLIDMGVVDPWQGLPPLRTSLVRSQLGLPQSSFVVGAFGSIAQLKRLEACVLAFGQLLARHPDSLFLIVGEVYDTPYANEIKALAERLGILSKIRFTGRTPRHLFDSYMLACDTVLNLRYPPKQQMSAVLIRAIAAGKPVIVSDIPEWRFFPEDFCFRVAADEAEVPNMAAHLIELADNPQLLRQRSRAARAFFEQRGNLPHMAAQYQSVFSQTKQTSQFGSLVAER
ncbi:MAG TPA: glycosyltransferase [Roseiflexaceae bacterium]|nr:glycosyltransferase [Roseiflexaceae bacterium]